MTDPVMLLSQLHGEGRVTFRALRAAGFYGLASIAEAPVQALADRAHLSARTARRLKTGAEEMVEKGIGLDSPESEAAAAAKAVGRRSARRNRSRSTIAFSEGVLPEEAALLVHRDDAAAPLEPTGSWESAEPAPPVHDAPEPGAPRVTGLDVAGSIAAAAEVAAGLSRATAPAPSPARPPEDSEPSETSRTFWGFG